MEYSFIENILKRANIQQIREFLLTGLELEETDNRTYADRLKKGSHDIIERMKKSAKDDDEFEEIFMEYNKAEVTHSEVFLEIGMIAGARLLFELLHKNESIL